MNRFDRVTSLLLLLQTRTVVTAHFLSEHFNVSERTIYRDIRTLETAGVPIGSEAGVGYFLEKGYHLPPVTFTLDEAAALLLGEKLLVSSLDPQSLEDFQYALNKIKAVIDRTDKDYLNALETDTAVFPTGSQFPVDTFSQTNAPHTDATTLSGTPYSTDRWLRDSRQALLHRRVVKIDYAALSSQEQTARLIEPIGLFYYNWHWHLIAWCRLRQGYRDFRLDRIQSFSEQTESYPCHSRLTLQQYLADRPAQHELLGVELLFTAEAARFVQEQRYMFGFVEEEPHPNGIIMRFLTHIPDYMARWLLQYTHGVQIIKGEKIREALQTLTLELSTHWNPSSSAS